MSVLGFFDFFLKVKNLHVLSWRCDTWWW